MLRHIEEIANELNISIERQYFKQLYRFNNQDLKHLEQEFDALQINRVACQGHINILESATGEEINELRDVSSLIFVISNYDIKILLFYIVMNLMLIYLIPYYRFIIFLIILIQSVR